MPRPLWARLAALLLILNLAGCSALFQTATPGPLPAVIPSPLAPAIPTDPLLTLTPSPTATGTATDTPTPWPTLTPTITATFTLTPTITNTRRPTSPPTETGIPTRTPIPTVTSFAPQLLVNRSFEDNTTGWEGSGLGSNDVVVCNVAQHGKCSFQMRGNGKEKVVFQDKAFAGLLGDAVTFQAWVKNEMLNPNAVWYFRAEIVVTYANGTKQVRQFDFDKNTYGWLPGSGGIIATDDYTAISLRLIMRSDSGRVFWDNARLEVTR